MTFLDSEALRVRNFAGIKNAEIELSRMNVFIGPLASGKSVSAKLLFYFHEIISRLALEVDSGSSKTKITANYRDLFLKYFPSVNWGKGDFDISYAYGKMSISVSRSAAQSSTVNINYSDYFSFLLNDARKVYKKAQTEDAGTTNRLSPYQEIASSISERLSHDIGFSLANQSYFIPAGRSFFPQYNIRCSIL